MCASRRFQPGEGPSRGLLRDCTTSPINRFASGGPDPLLRHREAFRQEDRLRHGDTHQLPREAENVAVGAEPQDP